jgi:hypothetical protein
MDRESEVSADAAKGFEHSPADAGLATDIAWMIALHSTACRRWLEHDPPRLAEVASTLATIEAASLQIGRDRFAPPRHPDGSSNSILFRRCSA